MSETKIVFNISFDREMINQACALASREGIPVTTWIKTVIQEKIDHETIATEDDLRNSFHNILNRIGMSYAELSRCAADNNFPSEQARIAWMALQDLETFLD